MISVVIPAYNNLENIRRLLKSIYKQFGVKNGEVIVVDDGSQICNMSILNNEFQNLKVIRLERNMGAATARNVGVKNALYDIIFFLDSDMELCDKAIGEVENSMSDSKVDAVVGTVRDIPLNRGIFQDYWALLKSYFHSLPRDYSSTFYPMIGGIRKMVLDDVGGFDGRIKGASIEDYEISMRLLDKGYRVSYNSEMLASTGYKNFLTSIKQSFNRSKKWGIMFLNRRRFDNHTTTFSQGMANVIGFSIWIFFVCNFFNPLFIIPAAAFFILFFYANRGFYAYVFKRRGFPFLLISISIYLISSFFITIGFLIGALYVFRSKESRRRAIYG